jgi:hypothetical protein
MLLEMQLAISHCCREIQEECAGVSLRIAQAAQKDRAGFDPQATNVVLYSEVFTADDPRVYE